MVVEIECTVGPDAGGQCSRAGPRTWSLWAVRTVIRALVPMGDALNGARQESKRSPRDRVDWESGTRSSRTDHALVCEPGNWTSSLTTAATWWRSEEILGQLKLLGQALEAPSAEAVYRKRRHKQASQ